MTDGIIKSTGNSRYLKSVANFLSLYPTYEDMAAALVTGTLPVDLNGINPDGWEQLATVLNKAALLTDATAKLCGYSTAEAPDATVDGALSKLKTALNTIPTGSKISMIELGSVTVANQTIAITTSGKPMAVFLIPQKIASTTTAGVFFICAVSGGKSVLLNKDSTDLMVYQPEVTVSGKTIRLYSGANMGGPYDYIAFSVK